MHHIIDEWNRAIAHVLHLFDSILAEATAGTQAMIPRMGADLTPLTLPWGAVEHQMHRYTEQISDAWDRVGDELSDIDGLPDRVMQGEADKRDWAVMEVEIRYTRAYRMTMSEAAEVMRQRAILADARRQTCPYCGAEIDRTRLSGMALNVECTYCRAIVTLEPGQALRAFASVGAWLLAEREALPAWEAMTRAASEIKRYRDRKDVPLGLLQHYEASARAYWTTRFDVEAAFVPEQRPYVPQKIASYMKSVEQTLRQHWQWRQYAGAR